MSMPDFHDDLAEEISKAVDVWDQGYYEDTLRRWAAEVKELHDLAYDFWQSSMGDDL